VLNGQSVRTEWRMNFLLRSSQARDLSGCTVRQDSIGQTLLRPTPDPHRQLLLIPPPLVGPPDECCEFPRQPLAIADVLQ